MNYAEVLNEFINICPTDEPIFLEDCSKYFIEKNIEIKNKDLSVYLHRQIKNNKIKKYLYGIYYKPSVGIFGERTLDTNKIIKKKYISNQDKIKGYYAGHYLFNKLGLTTQIPKYITIVTNECPNQNQYKNEKLKVIIRKPKIEITSENALYLQLLDVLNNREKVAIEVDNEKEVIYNFIEQNHLKFEKIFYYAKKTNNKNAIERLYELE